MKKIFIVMSFVLMGVCLYVSCSQDNAESEKSADTSATVSNDYEEQFAALQLKIDELNQQTFPNWGTDNTTRGWNFFKFLGVIVADAVGTLAGAEAGSVIPGVGTTVGAVIGGVAASIGVVVGVAGVRPYYVNSTAQDFVFPSVYSTPAMQDSIGLYHNEIIMAMKEFNPKVFDEEYRKRHDLLEEVCTISEQYLGLKSGTLTVEYLESAPAVKTVVDDMLSITSDHPSHDVLFQRMQTKYPELQKELQLVYDFVCNINAIVDDEDDNERMGEKKKYYVINLLQLIEEADLPENIKETLKVAIEVGYASSNLWEEDTVGGKRN